MVNVHQLAALAAIQQSKALAVGLAKLNSLQIPGSLEPWDRKTKEATVDAMSAMEGWLELNKPKSPERVRLMGLRRRLEWELWGK